MLNLPETIEEIPFYNEQSDIFIKFILYIFPIVSLIEILRNQVSEMNILQLVPGFYLFLFFLLLIIVVLVSSFLFEFPKELDLLKKNATKSKNKQQLPILFKFSFSLFFDYFFLGMTTLIPLSLDSFNAYTINTAENIWSFGEVLILELFLIIVLIILSQLPIYISFSLSLREKMTSLPKQWKLITFLCFLGSGFVTPTIDIYTQSAFAFSALFLYFLIVNILEKRSTFKYLSSVGLS